MYRIENLKKNIRGKIQVIGYLFLNKCKSPISKFLRKVLGIFTLDLHKVPSRFTILSKNILKLKIEAFLRLPKVMTNTKIKINTHHCKKI